MSAKKKSPVTDKICLGIAKRLLAAEQVMLEKDVPAASLPAPDTLIVAQAARTVLWAGAQTLKDPYAPFNGLVRALAIEAARQGLDIDTAMRAIVDAFTPTYEAAAAGMAQVAADEQKGEPVN